MEEEARKTIESLNALLGDGPYRVELADPKAIRLLDKNARYMSQETFSTLVGNVKKDGALSSLPLCYRENEGEALIVLSGNHRVQAAVHAGIEQILVLVIKRKLSREEQVSIQLSHNAIEGKDDPVILKELWGEIESIDLKMYSGLDSETLKDLAKMEFTTISDVTPDYKQIVFMFLPEEVEELKKLLEDADAVFSGDEVFFASRKHYEQVFSLVVNSKEHFNVVNHPTALMKLMELASERLEEIKAQNVE